MILGKWKKEVLMRSYDKATNRGVVLLPGH